MTDWQYEYNRLVNSAMQLNRMYKSKSKRIERAIEYINQVFMPDEETGEYYLIHTFNKDGIKCLLDILKGEDKE